MRTVTDAAAMQRLARKWQGERVPVGLVPTMGYLHRGHMSLVRRARQATGRKGKVVVSINVNPTQFGPGEDLRRYPRDLARDRQLCRDAGVDVVFAPKDSGMYPGREFGSYSAYVIEEELSSRMEGASRPGHFRGVTTVVAKLFNLVLPTVAVFGAKDFQQAAVLQRMARDLNFPVRMVVAPTVREADGLALSSRNKYLEGDLRRQAVVLWEAIKRAQAAVGAAKGPMKPRALKNEMERWMRRAPAARVDYIEFFEPETLQPVASVRRGTHVALAVFIGKTRLIDNARL